MPQFVFSGVSLFVQARTVEDAYQELADLFVESIAVVHWESDRVLLPDGRDLDIAEAVD